MRLSDFPAALHAASTTPVLARIQSSYAPWGADCEERNMRCELGAHTHPVGRGIHVDTIVEWRDRIIDKSVVSSIDTRVLIFCGTELFQCGNKYSNEMLDILIQIWQIAAEQSVR